MNEIEVRKMFVEISCHDNIGLDDLLEHSAGWASEICGMQGEAIYAFILGEAIIHLQKSGCNDTVACGLALDLVGKFRVANKDLFAC
ncbi:MAG TPA: hypothetical protein VF974_06020 [Patescibacteria group bacterium]